MMFFNVANWYWLADDGRVFASARNIVVTETDQDYVAWKEAGGVATPWPRDEQGNQTLAELQRTLFADKIPVDLKAYAFYLRDQVEKNGATVNVPPITSIRTDDYTQNLIARYQEVASKDSAFTVAWILPDRTTTTLDATAIGQLFDQLMAFIGGGYNTYSQVIADIDAGTITNTDQIEQAFGAAYLKGQRRVDIGWEFDEPQPRRAAASPPPQKKPTKK
jgi:hypothetical protein